MTEASRPSDWLLPGGSVPIANAIALDDVAVRLQPGHAQPVAISRLTVTVPADGFHDIIAKIGERAHTTLDGQLVAGGFQVRVPLGPLRVSVRFEIGVGRGGTLVLNPTGGVPGRLIGFVARLAGDLPGITVSSQGSITIHPERLVPEHIALEAKPSVISATAERLRIEFV